MITRKIRKIIIEMILIFTIFKRQTFLWPRKEIPYQQQLAISIQDSSLNSGVFKNQIAPNLLKVYT